MSQSGNTCPSMIPNFESEVIGCLPGPNRPSRRLIKVRIVRGVLRRGPAQLVSPSGDKTMDIRVLGVSTEPIIDSATGIVEIVVLAEAAPTANVEPGQLLIQVTGVLTKNT